MQLDCQYVINMNSRVWFSCLPQGGSVTLEWFSLKYATDLTSLCNAYASIFFDLQEPRHCFKLFVMLKTPKK